MNQSQNGVDARPQSTAEPIEQIKTGRVGWIPFAVSRKQASSRLRTYLPCEKLRARGMHCELFDTHRAKDYQLVIFQKAYQNSDIELAKMLKANGTRIVFDLCDNHAYIPPGQETNATLIDQRARLETMLSIADSVSVASAELGREITPLLATHNPSITPIVLDDFVEWPKPCPFWSTFYHIRHAVTQRLASLRGKPKALNLAWFGNAGSESPRFGMRDIAALLPTLEAFHISQSLQLTIYSNNRELFNDLMGDVSFPVRYVQWHNTRFPESFQCEDVALIPIDVNPFTRTKTSNRLVLSLMLNRPTLATPIPSYDVFSECFWACTEPQQWQEALLEIVQQPHLARIKVQEGQRIIAEQYSEAAILKQWEAFIQSELRL